MSEVSGKPYIKGWYKAVRYQGDVWCDWYYHYDAWVRAMKDILPSEYSELAPDVGDELWVRGFVELGWANEGGQWIENSERIYSNGQASNY